ncbi:MAG TPA: hypothetical protein VKS78_15970 [Roseiarcus sp.]|nr:hypothetical protein [Roseiarcus sp.]
MNRFAIVLFASLALLSSVFAAAPWKDMNHGGVAGYDDSFSAVTVATK